MNVLIIWISVMIPQCICITLYTLNVYSYICQLSLDNVEKIKSKIATLAPHPHFIPCCIFFTALYHQLTMDASMILHNVYSILYIIFTYHVYSPKSHPRNKLHEDRGFVCLVHCLYFLCLEQYLTCRRYSTYVY